MNKLFELGNRYAAKSDWKDFAFVKICLCAMGVLIGVSLPKKNMRFVQAISGTVFGATYFVLMRKVIKLILEMKSETSDLWG